MEWVFEYRVQADINQSHTGHSSVLQGLVGL